MPNINLDPIHEVLLNKDFRTPDENHLLEFINYAKTLHENSVPIVNELKRGTRVQDILEMNVQPQGNFCGMCKRRLNS